MNNVGMICDLSYDRHHLFKSYYHAIENLYGPPKIVKTVDDLKGIKILFIGDDHYTPHKIVWQQPDFIPYCNINNIKVVVFTNEKILNSFFSWNSDNLIKLKKIKNLYHYTSDVEDCIALGTKVNRMIPSKKLNEAFTICSDKKDAVIFIGNVNCPRNSYRNRKNVLEQLQKIMCIDVFPPTIPKWEDYLLRISEYKFVLSPAGNGDFFPMRFYEILNVGSVPIQQVTDKTLEYYDIEKEFKNCIFFKEVEELKEKLESFDLKQQNPFWLEDYLIDTLRKDGLL